MPISSLRQSAPEQLPALARELQFAKGRPDIDTAVPVAVEMLKDLGLVEDIDKVTEEVRAEFIELTDLGYNGRLYVRPSVVQATLSRQIAAAERRLPEGVAEFYQHPSLWYHYQGMRLQVIAKMSETLAHQLRPVVA